jgi:hypothetical protein
MGLEAQNFPDTETPEKPRTSSGRTFLSNPQLPNLIPEWRGHRTRDAASAGDDGSPPELGRAHKLGAYCKLSLYKPLCSISQPPFESSCWSSIHEGLHGFGGAGGGPGGRLGSLGGLPQYHAATPQSLPFSHRAAAADLRPTAENIFGASGLQSQRPMGRRARGGPSVAALVLCPGSGFSGCKRSDGGSDGLSVLTRVLGLRGVCGG